MHDWVFGDGEAPPVPIVDAWLKLVDERFPSQDGEQGQINDSSTPCIATHCVAGLGR